MRVRVSNISKGNIFEAISDTGITVRHKGRLYRHTPYIFLPVMQQFSGLALEYFSVLRMWISGRNSKEARSPKANVFSTSQTDFHTKITISGYSARFLDTAPRFATRFMKFSDTQKYLAIYFFLNLDQTTLKVVVFFFYPFFAHDIKYKAFYTAILNYILL